MEATGLSARSLARVLDVDERTVRRWLAGDREIPGPALQLLRLLTAKPKLVAVLTR
jgi:DNA-binding transcriptional regulator YiaG